MARKIPLQELEITIQKELAAYSDEVAEGIRKEVKAVAKETVAALKTTSPGIPGNTPGAGATVWSLKAGRTSGYGFTTAPNPSSPTCWNTATPKQTAGG